MNFGTSFIFKILGVFLNRTRSEISLKSSSIQSELKTYRIEREREKEKKEREPMLTLVLKGGS